MISFVVVSYNSEETIQDCLKSLTQQANAEVILVDNNSRDRTVELARQIPDVKVLAQTINYGFNGGNKIGVEASNGEVVVFFNPDAVAPANFSKTIVKYFDSQKSLGVLGAKIMNSDGTLQRTCNTFPSFLSLLYEHSRYRSIFPNSKAFARYTLRDWNRDSDRKVDAVSGACMAVRRIVLDKVGGLDTHYFLFFEEFDLSYRAKKIGYYTYFCSSISIVHIGGHSTKQERSDAMTKIYLRSRDYYIKRHYGILFLMALKTCEIVFDVFGGFIAAVRKLVFSNV